MHSRILLSLSLCLPLVAAHNPLLPRVQEAGYGAGVLPLAGLEVRYAAAPTAEDRFTGDEIAARLAAILGSPAAPAKHAITLRREGNLPGLPQKQEPAGPASREAYQLRVTPQGAEIRAASSAGLYYGAQTLLQLVEGTGAGAVLPEVQIRDWPSLAYRGVMMDLSHGGLPTEQEIMRQIDFLARFKANQYYFYSELSIELKGYPLINPNARYSQDAVHRIIEYARLRHVDVVPCLEFYGHLHDMFRLERYADMAPIPHGGEINPRHPKVMPALRDWIDQMAALFPSPWFHVGLDEPWELERAGSAAAGGIDPAKLYMGHLKDMADMLRGHHKTMMFWADVTAGAALFSRYPALASQVPPDSIAVPWHYNDEKSFERMLAPFSKAGVPQVIGTGIWGWQDISPNFDLTFNNIDGFLRDGRKHNVLGVVHTNWSDDAEVLFRATQPAMAYGAAAAWQNTPVDRAAFYSDYAASVCSPAEAPELAAGLAALARAQLAILDALGYETRFRLWDDPLHPQRLERILGKRESLRKARLEAEEAEEHLRNVHSDTVPSLLVGARLIDYAGMKYLYMAELSDYFKKIGPNPSSADVGFWLRTQASSRNHSRLGDLQDAITGLKEEYRAAWESEYTAYREGSALGRFDGEYQYWRRLQAKLWDFCRFFKDKSPLPPLESFRPM